MIRWRSPIATDLVIHADDDASKAIAILAADVIATIKGEGLRPEVISYRDLNQESVHERLGVLVIASCAGDGGELREISRDLRSYLGAETPRHFVVGVGFPQSMEAWDRLKQFLERNRTDRNYGFSAWLVMAVGSDCNGHAWDDCTALANVGQVNTEVVEYIDSAIANEALALMAACVRSSNNGFLPSSAGRALTITDGFYFFKEVFAGRLDEVTDAVSYLTVAAVLQSARDLKNAEFQLKPTGYESVVLHPECFLRFNDDILQGCMLRACHPSELDYSASPHLSKLMKEFVAKVFTRHTQSYGSAAQEFAAALASGRLKLVSGDMASLIDDAIDLLRTEPSSLLGFLLMAKLRCKTC